MSDKTVAAIKAREDARQKPKPKRVSKAKTETKTES